MSWIYRLTPLALCLFILVGCGERAIDVGSDNEENNDEQPTNNSTPDELLPEFHDVNRELVEARCELIFDCCDGEERADRFGVESDNIDDCVQIELGAFGGLGGFAIEDSWSKDRIEFREGQAQLCEEQLRSLSCADFDGSREERDSLPGCKDMIKGLVDLGDTCNGDHECQSNYCYFEVKDGETDGVCESPPEDGEACPELRCGKTSYCHRFDGICVPKKMNGESCFRNQDCLSELCREDTEGSLYCQSLPAICEG